MPLYPYRCTQCGHAFDKIQHFDAEPETICPKCGGPLERPMTAPAFNFKGSGWYVNDYAARPAASSGTTTSIDSGGSAAAESTPAETKPAESKPAAASDSTATKPATSTSTT